MPQPWQRRASMLRPNRNIEGHLKDIIPHSLQLLQASMQKPTPPKSCGQSKTWKMCTVLKIKFRYKSRSDFYKPKAINTSSLRLKSQLNHTQVWLSVTTRLTKHLYLRRKKKKHSIRRKTSFWSTTAPYLKLCQILSLANSRLIRSKLTRLIHNLSQIEASEIKKSSKLRRRRNSNFLSTLRQKRVLPRKSRNKFLPYNLRVSSNRHISNSRRRKKSNPRKSILRRSSSILIRLPTTEVTPSKPKWRNGACTTFLAKLRNSCRPKRTNQKIRFEP